MADNEHTTSDRFEEAVARLPQVRTDRKDKTRRLPRLFWEVARGAGKDGTAPLGNHTMDCFFGRALYNNFRQVTQDYPDLARLLIESTLQDMVSEGRLSGIEVGFLGGLVENIAMRLPQPFSVITGGAA